MVEDALTGFPMGVSVPNMTVIAAIRVGSSLSIVLLALDVACSFCSSVIPVGDVGALTIVVDVAEALVKFVVINVILPQVG